MKRALIIVAALAVGAVAGMVGLVVYLAATYEDWDES
jgi:hypothetical protein